MVEEHVGVLARRLAARSPRVRIWGSVSRARRDGGDERAGARARRHGSDAVRHSQVEHLHVRRRGLVRGGRVHRVALAPVVVSALRVDLRGPVPLDEESVRQAHLARGPHASSHVERRGDGRHSHHDGVPGVHRVLRGGGARLDRHAVGLALGVDASKVVSASVHGGEDERSVAASVDGRAAGGDRSGGQRVFSRGRHGGVRGQIGAADFELGAEMKHVPHLRGDGLGEIRVPVDVGGAAVEVASLPIMSHNVLALPDAL